MKQCPYCKEDVNDQAIKCRYCQSMLLPHLGQEKSDDDRNVTYVVDNGLIRFGKFAAFLLAFFLIAGAYVVGFSLDKAVERLRDGQDKLRESNEKHREKLRDSDEKLKTTEEGIKTNLGKLAAAQKDLADAQSTVRKLNDDVQIALNRADDLLERLKGYEKKGGEIVVSLAMQLDTAGRERLVDVQKQKPDKFRSPPVRGLKLWKNGITLRIRFLEPPSATLREKIQRYASEWTENANIRFEFGEVSDAEIRISFRHQGYWSFVGPDCLAVPKNEPTMNFEGFTDETPDSEVRKVVLAEFGNALGLIKEQKNPKANIFRNKEAVYKYFAASQGWPRDVVDVNVLDKYTTSELPDYREFDPQSIMMYTFPGEITLDGKGIPGGKELSASDKALIARLYPR